MDTIFVSIASYMDQEVEHTINDLLKKSKQPQNIIIGVCIQDTIEELDRYKKLYSDNSNVRSIYINHLESKGCCWARSKIQSELFQNEKYYLQLDAHHRFVDGWDTICIEMLNNCVRRYSNDKIILSSYAVPCDLSTDVMKITHQNKPYKMKCEKFYNTKKVRYVPEVINTEIIDEPILSYTISAHQLFTFGTWVHDVPYDPNLYFDGEEDSLAIRSFTHGWVTSMYEPPKMAQLEHWIKSSRQRAGATLVPTNVRGVAALLKALRRGETTAILPDQVPPAASGDFSPIFGVPAQTMTLVHNLIQKSVSQVLLCTALRADGGWRLHFMPAAEAINSADQQTSLDALNRGVESIVALAPSQYQWEYKRFKARPEGLPSIYPKGS